MYSIIVHANKEDVPSSAYEVSPTIVPTMLLAAQASEVGTNTSPPTETLEKTGAPTSRTLMGTDVCVQHHLIESQCPKL